MLFIKSPLHWCAFGIKQMTYFFFYNRPRIFIMNSFPADASSFDWGFCVQQQGFINRRLQSACIQILKSFIFQKLVCEVFCKVGQMLFLFVQSGIFRAGPLSSSPTALARRLVKNLLMYSTHSFFSCFKRFSLTIYQNVLCFLLCQITLESCPSETIPYIYIFCNSLETRWNISFC